MLIYKIPVNRLRKLSKRRNTRRMNSRKRVNTRKRMNSRKRETKCRNIGGGITWRSVMRGPLLTTGPNAAGAPLISFNVGDIMGWFKVTPTKGHHGYDVEGGIAMQYHVGIVFIIYLGDNKVGLILCDAGSSGDGVSSDSGSSTPYSTDSSGNANASDAASMALVPEFAGIMTDSSQGSAGSLVDSSQSSVGSSVDSLVDSVRRSSG